MDVGNFALLLVLFMFIYSLVGLQFFANRFHFDEDGDVVGIGEEGYDEAEVPRANFDTLRNAFTTIFVVRPRLGFSSRGGQVAAFFLRARGVGVEAREA